MERLKTQIEGSGANYEPILNDECQEVASQIAEEGNEFITSLIRILTCNTMENKPFT